MDINEMTPEQIQQHLTTLNQPSKLVESNTNDRLKRVTVDGLTIDVDVKKLTSWKSVTLQAQSMNDELTDQERFIKSIEYINFVFGDDLDAIVAHCGGDDAQAEDVATFVSRVMEAVSKN